ncbi:hypothetical protein ACFFQF_04570 [Haladaptatus pallidirubidus]|uniref:DUF7261 family protein n=1 Tax=Haladaptatus pallidirubidus TaxID=1008152 RepID=UPI0035E92F23
MVRVRDRAQLVLAAAAIVAVALAPVVFAYLQLGYSDDVTASNDYDAPVENAEGVLSRGAGHRPRRSRGISVG